MLLIQGHTLAVLMYKKSDAHIELNVTQQVRDMTVHVRDVKMARKFTIFRTGKNPHRQTRRSSRFRRLQQMKRANDG
jgi:hypothetical protein